MMSNTQILTTIALPPSLSMTAPKLVQYSQSLDQRGHDFLHQVTVVELRDTKENACRLLHHGERELQDMILS